MSVAINETEVQARVVAITCIDQEDHAFGCEFVSENGVLPCNCDATRAKRSWWWQCWLYWSQARVKPANARYFAQHKPGADLELVWPIRGADDSPWIPGKDFAAD